MEETCLSEDMIAALIDRAKNKDREAITALIHEVHPHVIARLRYCGVGEEDLKETSRKVYVKAFQSLDTLSLGEDFHRWILQIAEEEAKKTAADGQKEEILPPPEETAPEAEAVPVREEKKTPVWIPIAVIGCICIVILAAYLGMRAIQGKRIIETPFLRDEPSETIEELERALNELDEQAIIACLDKEVRDEYEQQENPEVHQWISSIGAFLKMTGTAPVFDLETLDVNYISDDTCEARVKLNYSWLGLEESSELTVPMILEEQHWHILAKELAGRLDEDEIPGDLF